MGEIFGVEAAFVFFKSSAKQLIEINGLIEEGKLKTHVETDVLQQLDVGYN